MDRLWFDLRYGLRQLRNSPVFTLTAIVTLALGIGANTAIFTLVNAVLFRSLPIADPAQLYRIGDNDDCCVEGGFPGGASDTGDFTIFSFDLYQYLKQHAPEFEPLAAAQAGQWMWSVRAGNMLAKPMNGELVSGNYFRALGLKPYQGRLFEDSDDTPGASPAVVLSYQAWQGEFSSAPSIVGSPILIEARPYTVVGIAPPGFFGDRETDSPPAFWMPLNTEPYLRADSSILHHPASHWLYLLGRVAPGTNLATLETRVSSSLRQWIRSNAQMTLNGGSALIPKQHVILTPAGGGIQNLQQEAGKGLQMLMILSSVVLVIAGANMANLLLARATSRRTQVALRAALGAGRRRILGQILTECLLLAAMGGAAGLALAYGGCHAILALAFPDAKYLPISAHPSLPVLGFAFVMTAGTGVLFAIAPAWLSFHAQPAEALRGVSRLTHDRSGVPQKALIVFQSALSVVLLTGAILMTKSLLRLEHQSFGLLTTNRYVLHFDPAGAGYTLNRLAALYRQIEDRFGALPSVTGIGLADYSPLEGDNWGECVIAQGHPAPRPGDHCGSTWDRVSPQFLDSIGVPIIHGRGFTDQDTATSTPVALVNQTFVRKFFPNQDPVGRHFGIDLAQYSGSWEIVGVFRDFKMNDPREPVHPVYLRPLAQRFTGYKEPDLISTESNSMFVQAMVIDFAIAPPDVDSLIRHSLAGIDPNLTVMGLRSFRAQVAGNFDEDRLIARLTSLFGALALILASVGLYGVMSYFVARRSGEIGIRMALGATRSSVLAMVLGGALGQILMGLALGIPAALLAGYEMTGQLYQVSYRDPSTLVGAVLVLTLCALSAASVPARRAAMIEPVEALRNE
jgi:macrolide transport system ATP-binding/permease protein